MRARGELSWLNTWKELLYTIRTDAVTELGFRMFSDVRFHQLPVSPVIADLLARRADRNEPPEDLDFLEGLFQFLSSLFQFLLPSLAAIHLLLEFQG